MTSKQSNLKPLKSPNPKNPIETLYNRRLAVRYQKRQLINVRLAEFSERFIFFHGLILLLVSVILIGVQIGIFINRTKLYYTASGFWMGLVFMLCSLILALLRNKRSYGYLKSTLSIHFFCILSTIGGIIVNVFDMAYYNMKCMNACESFSTQYLNLMVIVFGASGLISIFLFLVAIEYYVLSDSRKLNVYLQNRK